MSLFDILRGNIPDKESFNNLQNKVDKLLDLFGIAENDNDSDINLKTLLNCLEELKIEQSLMKDEIINLKSEIELLSKKNNKENTIANENKPSIPTTELKQQVRIEKKHFYMEPSRNGEFKMNAKLINGDENDRDAFYVILLSDDNDNFAEFYPVSNKSERLLMSKEDILDPVCNIQSNSSGGRLTIISNGKLQKEDSMWVVINKCVIKFS